MRVYISGPITGIMDYRKKFAEAEQTVKEMGHIAISPAYLPEGLRDYIPICFAMLDQADAILLLPGWEDSKGATMEYKHAALHNIKIYIYEEETKECKLYKLNTQEGT